MRVVVKGRERRGDQKAGRRNTTNTTTRALAILPPRIQTAAAGHRTPAPIPCSRQFRPGLEAIEDKISTTKGYTGATAGIENLNSINWTLPELTHRSCISIVQMPMAGYHDLTCPMFHELFLLLQCLIPSQLHTKLEKSMPKRKDLARLTGSSSGQLSVLLSVLSSRDLSLSSPMGVWNLGIRSHALTIDMSMT